MTAQETITSLTEYGEVMRFEEKHGYPIGEDVLDAIDNAVRLLKEQEEELAKLREDKARLDWLEACQPMPHHQLILGDDNREHRNELWLHGCAYNGPTLRAAIDSARKGEA